MTDFFINANDNSVYPSSHFNYNPDTFYPEYKWGNSAISEEKNYIYAMVRECLIGMDMDAHNFNTQEWNPFGELIREGDTVVIKPNWVMHFNKNKNVTKNSLECLITHPSILRAVTDYCLIALKGTGKIIIGDAPMQGCDLDNLIEKSGYKELFQFYNDHHVHLSPTDFRQFATIVDKNKVLVGRKYNSSEAIEVQLDLKSRLNSTDLETKQFTVSDYNKEITNKYHHAHKHSYLINKEVLSADVVINLCKPKCHRLGGITGAMKNFVGITFEKACLPHRTIGSKQSGGDEYLYNSFIKKIISKVLIKKILFEERSKLKSSLIMRYLYGLLYYLMKYLSKDNYLVGSWYGNDTIWRTVLDLYNILLYADKNGQLRENKQRRIFSIADMIISGERNGPVAPEPKELGIIIAGYDAVMMDRLLCEIMGFDFTKIPSVYHAVNDEKLIQKESGNYNFNSNLLEFKGKNLDELEFPTKWRFKPYDTWKGHIEKNYA